MSLLATLGLELDKGSIPASGLGWLVDYGKLPLAPAPLGSFEVLGGALEGGLPGGGEPLAGKDWWGEPELRARERIHSFILLINTECLQCARHC